MDTTLLQTERLILRDYVADDWRACHEYASQPRVVQFMPWGPNDEAATRDFIARCMEKAAKTPRTDWEVAVVLRDQNRLIGGCGIGLGEADRRSAGIGYCYNPEYWGHGYATEAASALLQFGFVTCGLHRIWATADVCNVASWRIMEKLGMRREAHFRQHVFQHGAWRDSYLYAILEDEWRARGGIS